MTVLNATSGTLTAANLVTAINSYSTQDGGVTAATGGNGLILTAADGSNIQLNQNLNPLAATASTGGITNVTSYNATDRCGHRDGRGVHDGRHGVLRAGLAVLFAEHRGRWSGSGSHGERLCGGDHGHGHRNASGQQRADG